MSRFFIQEIRTDTRNLLDDWHVETWAQSSDLAPKKLYDRARVQGIRSMLLNHFGEQHFVHTYGTDQPLDEIDQVKRLLMRPFHTTSFAALSEMCDLLRFAEGYQPKLHTNLRRQRTNPRQFKASLYEAHMALQFMRAGIEYMCETKIEGKPRDGSFRHKDAEWIVECKQQYAPTIDEFDVMRRATDQVMLQLRRWGVEGGMGFVLRIKRPASERAVASLSNLFEQALLQYSYPSNNPSLVLADDVAMVEILPLGTLDPGHRTTDTEFVARIEINPANQSPSISPVAPIAIALDFGYSKHAVLRKLESVIHDAREQHRDRGNRRLIICIDSQELPDLELGILQGSDILESKSNRERIQAAVEDAMVLVTQRQYYNQQVRHRLYMFYQTRDELLANHLSQALGHLHSARTKVFV